MEVVQAPTETGGEGIGRNECPLCLSGRIGKFLDAPDVTWLRRFPDARESRPPLPAHRCRDCDLVFLNPQPPLDAGREYYERVYRGEDSSGHRYYSDGFKQHVGRIRAEFIGRLAGGRGSLLDVGCGRGHFVRVAEDRGWEAWGVETSPEGCAYARRVLGLDRIICGTLDDDSLPSDLDVVTLWDVIEHVTHPVEVISAAASRLHSGGHLVVRTGNIRSWEFDRNRRGWWAWFSDHRFYFSPKSLRTAFDRAGLELIDVLDLETVERPSKTTGADISDTPALHGLAAVLRTPSKIVNLGRYVRNRLRRRRGRRRHGSHYDLPIMTAVARRRA